MKLLNKNLKLISVHRTNILEANNILKCDNCGKQIINYAKVTDEAESYYIGLDCKKKLIDNNEINKLDSYDAKIYKRNLNEVNKFLLATSKEGVFISINTDINFLSVVDPEEVNQFGKKGTSIYGNSLGFLQRMGLAEYINNFNKQ